VTAARTALVTGGTAGIGFEVAAALAQRGMQVVITGRDEQRGDAAATDLRRRAAHDRIEFIAVDHLTVGGNQYVAACLDKRLDRLDVLVNNVGRVFSRREETAEGFEASLALIFLGPYALTYGLRRLLLASEPARVVNMNSSAFKMWKGDPLRDLQSEEEYVGIRAHARAKLLNVIWTVALAQELEACGVTVNAVNPGSAWTPGTAALTPEAVPFWRPIWPLVRFFQRRGSSAKAAQTPIWLATDPAAAQLTGGFFEKKRQQKLPEIASRRDEQDKVLRTAAELVRGAPTALPSAAGDRRGAP
jgi:NAD(P)-dependent dehydrogenase (short-subunit alcohol dehydrogenase family)